MNTNHTKWVRMTINFNFIVLDSIRMELLNFSGKQEMYADLFFYQNLGQKSIVSEPSSLCQDTWKQILNFIKYSNADARYGTPQQSYG